MISTKKIEELAQAQCASALNQDWKNRGTLTVKKTAEVSAEINGKLLETTVAVVEFEKPLADPLDEGYNFDGFLLVILERNGKLYTEASPKFSKYTQDDIDLKLQGMPFEFLRRLCPKCGGIDTTKRKTLRRGSEFVVYEYSCSCGYKDQDVID